MLGWSTSLVISSKSKFSSNYRDIMLLSLLRHWRVSVGLEGYKVWGSQALWWSSVLVKVVGHLLWKLSWICLGNFWIRELTNNITMQNSIASFEFDSETRWPTLNMGLGGLKFNPSSLKQFKGHYAFICVCPNTNFHLLINNIYCCLI